VAGNVRFLLGKVDEGVASVESHYRRDLDAKSVSDDLLYDVRRVVQDCQSALDWTASAVNERYGSGRTPYFPLARRHEDFEAELDRQITGLRTNHPAIAAAFERHQPYQAGSEVLGYLRKLSRVNKHQDFSAQTRTERLRTIVDVAGVGVADWDSRAVTFASGVSILGAPIDPATQRPAPNPAVAVTSVRYIDWRFVDPPTSVLRTLQSLARLVREAVADVETVATL
jgi:hypothetical protein